MLSIAVSPWQNRSALDVSVISKAAPQSSSQSFGFGGGLFAREVAYLKADEWALAPEDILWRRTKCGLAMTEAERRTFAANFK